MDVNETEIVKETSGIPKKAIEEKWYAIYTRPRAEKLVNQRLLEQGFETFLPLQRTYRIWSDRKKLVEIPLLSSYLFIKIKANNFHHVYRIQGIVKLISFEGKPVSIPEKQINNIRLLVNSDAQFEVSSEKFAKGDNVEVISGSLVGLKGELIKVGKKNRVVIRIDKLDQNLLVKIPVAFLRKM